MISQSGETADTPAAIKLAKEAGAFLFGICNVVGFIARAADTVPTPMQVQKLVASTKAFTTQITLLMLIDCVWGNCAAPYLDDFSRVAEELEALPNRFKRY